MQTGNRLGLELTHHFLVEQGVKVGQLSSGGFYVAPGWIRIEYVDDTKIGINVAINPFGTPVDIIDLHDPKSLGKILESIITANKSLAAPKFEKKSSKKIACLLIILIVAAMVAAMLSCANI